MRRRRSLRETWTRLLAGMSDVGDNPRPGKTTMRVIRLHAAPALVAALLLLSAPGDLLAAEVYGKPLRGLTAVPVRDAVSDPERFAGRDVRVTGLNAGPEGKAVLKEGDALLPIVTDGSFELPAKLGNAKLAAEGRVTRNTGAVVFVASGVEVKR